MGQGTSSGATSTNYSPPDWTTNYQKLGNGAGGPWQGYLNSAIGLAGQAYTPYGGQRVAGMTPRRSSPGTPRRRLFEAPVARKIARKPSRSRSGSVKSRPMAVSSRSSTPWSTIRWSSAWRTSSKRSPRQMPRKRRPP